MRDIADILKTDKKLDRLSLQAKEVLRTLDLYIDWMGGSKTVKPHTLHLYTDRYDELEKSIQWNCSGGTGNPVSLGTHKYRGLHIKRWIPDE